jgi:hypothetical protein
MAIAFTARHPGVASAVIGPRTDDRLPAELFRPLGGD